MEIDKIKAYELSDDLLIKVEAYIEHNYEPPIIEPAEPPQHYHYPPVLSDAGMGGRVAESAELYDSLLMDEVPPELLPEEEKKPKRKKARKPRKKKVSLDDAVANLGESFQERLLRMIDERDLTDPEVYKKADLDRKLFSKIRCNKDYVPKKKTVVALAVALELNMDDARDLLASAGYALTNNNIFDVIINFCLENGIYDIYEVDVLLDKYGQPMLG